MLSVIILSGGLVTCTKNIIEKEKDKSCDLSVVVGHHIEISNLFLHDLEYIIRFIDWLKKRG